MLKFYSEKQIQKIVSRRQGETKFGEKVGIAGSLDDLEKSAAHFVVFGIPEDIGVRANFGKPGTSTAWSAFLGAFLNVQENDFNSGEKVLLLGELNSSGLMEKAARIDESDPNYVEKLGDLVVQLDAVVSKVVKRIISSGKFPIIIGGGHNNAFGNIKGAAEAFGGAVNVLNIDAHTDLRRLEHRHSGNGFSYAVENGFLKKYSIFGLHRNYTPQYIFAQMRASEAMHFTLFEDLPQERRMEGFQKNLDFIKQEKFGLEVDCDAIANFPSSAISPVGFSLEEVRKLLAEAARETNCCYLHICEAIAANDFPTGKALAYMVTDFLRERKDA